jgi:hypothetical protein
VVLALSAYWERDIRVLHFFQARMYVATIVLSFLGSRRGHFIGISAAGFWNYANIFATTFFFNGLEQLASVDLLAASRQILAGYWEIPSGIRADRRLLLSGYGSVSASMPRHFSARGASAHSLLNQLGSLNCACCDPEQ